MNRREFIVWMMAAGAVAGGAPLLAADPTAGGGGAGWGRKLLIVQFGGGTRYRDTVGDPRHRFIPNLWNDLVPRGTLFTNMRVEGKVVHPTSTGSMMSGHWEWQDLDWTRPLAHPSIFELYRRGTGADDLSAWAFVYASILAKAGESSAPGFGGGCAANVVVPPTIPRETAETMDRIMAGSAAKGDPELEIEATAKCAGLARETSRMGFGGLRSEAARQFVERHYARWKAGAGSTSHDAFLADAALACMREHAPDVLAVCFGEIDCAHYGSWSRYTDAIERTDALTARLWREVEALDAYRGRTLMLILPDHGRELDETGGTGFVHHSDFYTDTGADEGCRRVWMMVLGPGVPAGRVIGEPVPITTVAATGLEFLGVRASEGAAGSVWHRLAQGFHESMDLRTHRGGFGEGQDGASSCAQTQVRMNR